jgi:C-terminal processing protease CtpA/Prc
MGFFDNMDSRPIQSGEWREYEITGRVDDDAVMIFFGAILAGNGQAWFDDFQLKVKGEDNRWESIDVRNPGFEEGETGQKPKFWGTRSAGYHYIVEETDAVEGSKCLLLENRSVKYKGKPFKEHPPFGEMIAKELGSGLSCRIPLALYSDESGTLGSVESDAFDSLTAQLKEMAYNQMNTNNEDVRLADVIMAWNVFQHFYPYFDVVDVDWDVELTNTLSDALQDKTEEDFFYTLSRMVAKLNDGHGSVMHSFMYTQLGIPIRVEWVENQLVVTGTKDNELVQRGDIILSIDGVEAKKSIEDAERFLSGSPQWKRVRSCWRFGYGEKGTMAKLQIKRGQEILGLALERHFQGLIEEWNRPPLQELQDGVYYVNLDKAPWNVIQPELDKIANAKGVVFDMRGYPKGNHEVICHLLADKDTSKAWMQIPQIIYPDQENIVGYQKMGWNLVPKKPRIKGKVVFITDGRAISYAESFMSFIEHYKLGEIVGQPTAGANGNNNPFSLPGGFRVGWTGMRVVKHDGSQHHQIGIQPTVPVKRTLQGVIEGRDELLEKALELIQ